MVRQYRYVMGEESIEFPAGSHEHDPDMDPRALAEAECVEETGYFPKKLELLGRLNTAPATFTSRFTIFLGTKLKKRKQKLDPEEVGLEVLEVSIAEFEKLLTSGKITDAPTVAAYGLAKAKRLF
jgi:8-oxo-dGTP pyrophosphatase MutT (NUDIX family)